MAHSQLNTWNQIARSINSSVCHSCRRQLLQTRSRRAFSSIAKLQQQPYNYQRAQHWQGLEWIGTKEWLYNRNKGAIAGKFFENPIEIDDATEIEAHVRLAAEELVSFIEAEEPLEFLDLQPVPENLVASIPFNLKPTPVGGLYEINLQDLNIRFAFVKRVMKRTGRRISDAYITKSHTAADVLRFVLLRQKKEELSTVLQVEERLAHPNVKLSPRKQTEIMEDQQVGRWKVIKHELMRRGLPITENTIPKEGHFLRRTKVARGPLVNTPTLLTENDEDYQALLQLEQGTPPEDIQIESKSEERLAIV